MRIVLIFISLTFMAQGQATPVRCDRNFLNAMDSQNYAVIKQSYGPGRLDEKGPLYIWERGGFLLKAGRIGKDMGILITPSNKPPPSAFSKALNVQKINKLKALLGEPKQVLSVGYYSWPCIDASGEVQRYYLVIDNSGVIYFEPFTYVTP